MCVHAGAYLGWPRAAVDVTVCVAEGVGNAQGAARVSLSTLLLDRNATDLQTAEVVQVWPG